MFVTHLVIAHFVPYKNIETRLEMNWQTAMFSYCAGELFHGENLYTLIHRNRLNCELRHFCHHSDKNDNTYTHSDVVCGSEKVSVKAPRKLPISKPVA